MAELNQLYTMIHINFVHSLIETAQQQQQLKETNHRILFCLMNADNRILVTLECLFVSACARVRAYMNPILSLQIIYKLQNVCGYANSNKIIW